MVREGGKSGSYLYQRADQGWPPPRPVDPVEIGHCCQNCRARLKGPNMARGGGE
jgi:hypothetical protein